MPRLISLNCWGGRLHDPLMKFIVSCDADVLCLQEVNAIYSARQMKRAEEFPMDCRGVRLDLFSEISTLLPDHQALYFPAVTGFLHDEQVAPGVQFGIATFVRRNFPIIAQKSTYVYGAYRHSGVVDHPLPRNAHCMELYDPQTRQPFIVAHMHGIWQKGTQKADTLERLRQAHILRNSFGALAQTHHKVFACGDFNVLPTSKTFEFLERAGLRDLVTGNGHTDTRTSFYKGDVRYADYMFVDKSVKVRSFSCPAQPEVSGHRPLILDFE